jgi:hypothetical protein
VQLSEHYHPRRDFEKFRFRFTTTRYRDLENFAFASLPRLTDIEKFQFRFTTMRLLPPENFARAGPGDSCRPCRPPRLPAASLSVEHEPSDFRRPGPLRRPASSVAGGRARPMRLVRDVDLPMGRPLGDSTTGRALGLGGRNPAGSRRGPVGRSDSKSASAGVAQV